MSPEISPMAKPSLPRLDALDPKEVATLVDVKLASFAGAFPRGDVAVSVPTKLGARAAELTRYAQLGSDREIGSGMSDEHASNAIEELIEALFRRPIDERVPWSLGDERDPFGDPNDPITCLILAALARRALSAGPKRGLLVNARWLAALASIAVSRVYQLLPRQRREVTKNTIDAREAITLLAERAVPGFVHRSVDTWRAEVEAFHAAARELDEAKRERTRSAIVARFWTLKNDAEIDEASRRGLEQLFLRFNRAAPSGADLRTLRAVPRLAQTIEEIVDYVADSILLMRERDAKGSVGEKVRKPPPRLNLITVNDRGPAPLVAVGKLVATICNEVNGKLRTRAGEDGIAPEYELRMHPQAPSSAELGAIVVDGPGGMSLTLRILPPHNPIAEEQGLAPMIAESKIDGRPRVRPETTTTSPQVQDALLWHFNAVHQATMGDA